MNVSKSVVRTIAVFTFVSALVLTAVQGQDAPDTAPAGAAEQEAASAESSQPSQSGEESLADLMTQWSEMDKRLIEAETAARADGAAAEAKTAYIELVDQAYVLIDRIQTAAIEAIGKDPNDEAASQALLGIMVNGANRTDGDKNALQLAEILINAGKAAEFFAPAVQSDRLGPFGKEVFDEIATRQAEHQADDLPRVKLTTSQGEIVVELFENEAPNTVANFISLVKSKFYDGLTFHRVIEGFVAQGGCPNGDGSGGPEYKVKCECYQDNARKHYTGSLSMAHAGRDTGGSQFFLTFRATSALDGRHTVFGRVVSGMDVLEKLTRTYTDIGPIPGVQPDKIVSAEVIRDRGHEYQPVKVGDPPAGQPSQ